MELEAAVHRLAALAQPTRLAVFRLLVQAGPQGRCVGDIAAALGTAPATLSFHLKELASAQLITARQESRFVYYSANFVAMNHLLAYLTQNCCAGQPCEPVNTASSALGACV